jgi:hypothetical protein
MNTTAETTRPTTPITTRTLRRLTATAQPFRATVDTAPTPLDRLRATLDLIGQERWPGGDYHPADADVITAWDATRADLARDPDAAIDHLDTFVRTRQGELRDLMIRAQYGQAPTRLLTQVATAITTELKRQ